MNVVHCSDLHLGFRQFNRLTPAGINQREADVAGTFTAAISRIIELAPELVVIAGDIFHSVRPSNVAVLHASRQFRRLRAALPRTPIVIVAGNHDAPRESGVGGILRLFELFGVHVVDREVKRLAFPELGLSVLAVPDVPGVVLPALTPDASARFNVLLLHGEVQGMLKQSAEAGTLAAVEIPREELGAEAWDYVALGHYHVHRVLAPNCCYSGSIDYTSSNIWGELAEERQLGLAGKGIVERNLVTGVQTFHPLPASRRFVDVAIDVAGLAPADVDEMIREAVDAAGGTDGAAVRIIAHGLSKETNASLDHRAMKGYRTGALSFAIDPRRVDVIPSSLAPYDPAAESEALNAEMRLLWGDDDRIKPATADTGSVDELIAAGIAADATDPYELDRYPHLYFPSEE